MLYKNYFKRIFDFCSALFGIVVLSPLLLIVAILVKTDSTGPILFKQERVGLSFKTFNIMKFRSMKVKQDSALKVTSANDDRITKTGRILRRYKIDELPQLFNVLIGDMSLVGPRPEVQEYVDHYTPEEKRILHIRPGITSPASLRFKNEEEILAKVDDVKDYYINTLMHEKLKIDLEYEKNIRFLKDIKIILNTIFK